MFGLLRFHGLVSFIYTRARNGKAEISGLSSQQEDLPRLYKIPVSAYISITSDYRALYPVLQ
jgi:hypothetical protein